MKLVQYPRHVCYSTTGEHIYAYAYMKNGKHINLIDWVVRARMFLILKNTKKR